MVKFYNSLQFRLTASFVILITLIAGFSYYYTYRASKNAIKQTVREELMLATDMVASQIRGERLAKLTAFKPGEEQTSDYLEYARFLHQFRKRDKDIDNIFIMKKSGGKVFFIVDDYVVIDPNETAAIGEEYKDYDTELDKAFKGVKTASKDFYTDKWGTFLSGYAPIKDDHGKVVAVLGADMKVEKAVQKQNFIGSLIYVVMFIAILAAGLIILFFSATIIRDVNALTRVANQLTQGDLDVEMPVITSKNEIGELNHAMKSVLAAVELLRDFSEQAMGASAAGKEDKENG